MAIAADVTEVAGEAVRNIDRRGREAMGTEPLAFRDTRGRTQMPLDQKVPVPRRERNIVPGTLPMRWRFIQDFQAGQ
jgi:hypothetical protein